jgi:hypothetical protein
MSLPPAVAQTLIEFGFASDVRAGIAEQYRFLGPGALEALVELTEGRGRSPVDVKVEDLAEVRAIVGARFLESSFGAWKQGDPSAGFWRNRKLEGGATGMAIPLGDLDDAGNPFSVRVARAAEVAAGPDQPHPQGLLVLSKGGHYGNRPGEFSMDLVPSDLESALAVNAGVGQQHTLPGSIGETSGTATGDPAVALVWEIQPNIYKPSADRNQAANKVFRKHRNWHLITAIASFAWLEQAGYRTFVLKGSALALAHEVNADKPLTPEIESAHDRTVEKALGALGMRGESCAGDPDGDVLRELVDKAFSHDIGERKLSDLMTRVEPIG